MAQILLQFCLVTMFNFAVSSDELLAVQAVWRHGSRTPVLPIPTDEANTAESWGGLGELTKLGMEMAYDLGDLLRRKYVEELALFGPKYRPNELYIRSTDYNRTLSTAYTLLAALMPPDQDAIPERFSVKGLRWQPIPVHAVPKEMDQVLRMNLPCPVAERLQRGLLTESPEIVQELTANQELLRNLENQTGISGLDSIYNTYKIWDPLYVMATESRPWPAYITPEVFARLDRIYHLEYKYAFHDPIVARLRGGLLLTEIIDRFRGIANSGGNDTLKFYGYSSHDYTMAVLLEILGQPSPIAPSYTSAITLELWKSENGSAYVKGFYRPNATTPLNHTELSFFECPWKPCTIESLAQAYSGFMLTPAQRYRECGLMGGQFTIAAASESESPTPRSRYGAVGLILFGMIFICVIQCGVIMVLCFRTQHRICR